MRKEIAYCRSRTSSFALLAIDIDHFKSINDTHGHGGGDAVLNQFAALLSNDSRAGDYVFRLGGEEFLVLLVDIDIKRAAMAAENQRTQIAATQFQLPRQQHLRLTASMGLAPHDGHPDCQLTLRKADEALYAAKAAGRDRIVMAEAATA
jgi:diguanylate cyclase